MLINKFRNLSISAKLNVIQAATIFGLFVVAIIALNAWLSSVFERQGIEELKRTNQQAVDMVETVRVSLEKAAERLARTLQADFSGEFAMRTDETVEVGGARTPVLSLEGKVLNGNVAPFDRFTANTTAAGTLFVRQGDDFVRIATSLKKEDGTRAMGTPLGARHPARELLLAGKTYTGKARLFGRDYMTNYRPLLSASGQVVGALFVGLDFSEQLADMKKKLRDIKLFETGYIFGIDAGTNKGELVLHPTREGENLWDAKDSNDVYYIREMVEQKEGVIYYLFPKPHGAAEGRKVSVFMSVPAWNWVVATSVHVDDLNVHADAVRNRLILGAVVLCVLLCATLFFSSRYWVTQPLMEVVKAMRRIASGDLTVAIKQRSEDEVGQLLKATNKMAGDMRTTLSDIQSASFRLAENAAHLSSSAMQVATQSGLQSDAASAMAASIEEINANIVHVAENASHANGVSVESGHVSGQGAEVIGQAVASMTRIAETVRTASSAVTTLGQESKAISAIVSVIREIAEQTNLLALNAAIEAARAGEQGRGFAVVADEVRKLAERTSASTQEISTLISGIQAGTEGAVTSMNSGVQQVEEGMVFAENAGASIANIRESAGQVNAAVMSISHAIDEQTAAIAEIAKNVEKIASMADDSNVMAKKSADYAAELEKLAESLRARVAGFTI
ncbi:methyl-accepting chemotaxis protein [Azonexus sp.]|jgi:methyl-accepting chemotaxis protein-2 (aspartate sensor receptor)|uniref:methyl-accepting chemotaxis protein n=1 Tax=Azonexus sp. TaxID=1872668 RepID=UPI0028365FF1|nr:methyl-accepting chemotaxis protein [Azonexus sp.]MDR1995024.1 methyl-accepting chemotaxis protein [Azonexus sp.]